MSGSESPTLRQVQVPVALVVGGSPELVCAVEEAALSVQLLVADCAVGEATNTAASMRPLVMVMNEDVYAFDPDAFDALARDVRAQILAVPVGGMSAAELQSRLEAVMVAAENVRSGWSDEFHER